MIDGDGTPIAMTTFTTIDEQAAMNRLVANGIRIPPWPRVLMELRQVLDTGDTDARTLSRILGKDPGIAAMLYRAAKSPALNPSRRSFDRLDQVVMLLGVRQTLSLVQAVVLATTLTEGNKEVLNAFWTRSEEIAEIAALIAEDRVSVCNIFPEQAYMAGIFRDCGIPVLMQRFPDYCTHLPENISTCWPHVAEEDKRFDTDHCVIGYLIAKHWKLPDFIANGIRYHTEMPSEEMGAVRSLVSILHMACYCHSLAKETTNQVWPSVAEDVLVELGIHPEDAPDFVGDIVDRFLALA